MMRIWQGAFGRASNNGIVSPAYIVLKPKENVDSLYATYLFKTPRMIYFFWAYSYGLTSDRLRLYYKDFSKIRVNIPPLPEQRKIAKILQTWDRAIDTTEKLIAASKQQKKALMQQLLTGKRRFSGFEWEWEEVRLGDLCTRITDGAHHSPPSTDRGFPMYSVKDMGQSQFKHKTARLISKGDYDILVKQNCKPEINDILIAKDGSILKNCFVVKENIEGVLLSSIALLRPKTELVYPDFVAHYFSQSRVRKFVGKAYTTGSGVPRIVLKDFKCIKIPLPFIDEQRRISEVLTGHSLRLSLLEKRMVGLEQEKKALMQQLLTGKRRVKVDE